MRIQASFAFALFVSLAACQKGPPASGTDAAVVPAASSPEGPSVGMLKPAGGAPADVAAPPADAQRTPSGVSSKVLKKGTGTTHPNPEDTVTVNYTGWTTDGKMFDSSEKHGKPISFPLNGVIKGWTDGVALMVEGEKRRLWIPEELAYKGQPGRPQGMLVFDIELLEIKPGVKPPTAPTDLKEAPADAQKSKSGLAWKTTTKGTGTEHPTEDDVVKVEITGWTSDGTMFLSTKGKAPTIPVNSLTKGFTEGVVGMVVGEKRLLWIPESLGFKDDPQAPQGLVVLEVELLEFKHPPKAPADVKAPPADAEKTASGLVTKVIAKGTGASHPGPKAVVQVHYTGWTTDGKMFDSSVIKGQPETLQLGSVIPGWSEGVKLMVEGEKRRLWIPEKLAYAGRPGAPAGMLVFDIELIKILKP